MWRTMIDPHTLSQLSYVGDCDLLYLTITLHELILFYSLITVYYIEKL